MRIAQVVPLNESVPPRGYGGTERVVSYLTEELVALGHQVTLFATGDSVTSARLIVACPQSLRSEQSWPAVMAHYSRMLGQVIHFHSDFLNSTDFLQPFLFKHQITPHVTTLHWRLDIPELGPLYEEFRSMPVTSVTHAQREPLPWLNWQGTIHHGVPEQLYIFHGRDGMYLAFLGRLCQRKGPDRAIQIARQAGMKIKVAGNVLPGDQEYFDQVLAPLFQDPLVEFVGELGQDQKNEFLGDAHAVLFPIDWPEPFGIVVIEALACGTPVIAYRRGSVPEVIDDGVTGFIVDGIEDAVAAVARVTGLSRMRCRQAFEERFTASRMTRDYLAIYERLLQRPRIAIPRQ